MKIAFFHELPYGGARRAVLEFGNELKKKHNVDLYYLDVKREKKAEKIFSKSKFYKFTPKDWKGNDWKMKMYKDTLELFRLYKIHKEIAQVIDEGGYDFAFVHGSKFTQAPFILKFLKTKSVYYCQEPLRMVYEDLFDIPEDLSFGKKIYERINRNNRRIIDKYNAKKANLLLANSKFTQRNIKKYLGFESKVSYMGIDPKIFYPEKIKKEFDILFVGSRDNVDGYSLLIDALRFMKNKSKVRWLLSEDEWIDDDSVMRKLYSSSKILTCLAYKEPFGLLPIEAQACGTVVVAVNEGGYLDTVNPDSGVLVKRNSREIAKALDKLLANKERMKKLSKKSSEEVNKNWTWEIASKRLIENINSEIN